VNADAWNSLAWDRVTDKMCLPNIAALVQARLEDNSGSDFQHDDAVVGATITRQLSERREQKSGLQSFRLSGSGQCQRRMAMAFHGVPEDGFRTDASGKLAFAMGDAVEAITTMALLEAANKVPWLDVTRILAEQERVHVQVDMGKEPWDSFRVPGHPDGWVNTLRWMRGETPEEAVAAPSMPFVLEIKSGSDYAFKKFREHGMQAYDKKTGNPDGYYWQTQAYQLAHRQRGIDVEWSYVLMFGKGVSAKDIEISPNFEPPLTRDGKPRKTYQVDNPLMWRGLAPIHGQWIRRDEQVQRQIPARFREVALSEDFEEFERALKPGKDQKLGFPCSWCPYLNTCWPNAREIGEKRGWFHTVAQVTTLAE